ncbi:MAG TPA: acetyl-CoA carboxylase, carboxyltransferase subunit beta [Acidobacteriota bacterium]|jgi:acetyl-CoA carboxylase carboxyl transferase subunit beta|nr:acetyl-CoA carboxylase, carboxyltransferase subunit beta [Acidobacteriota bacterium]
MAWFKKEKGIQNRAPSEERRVKTEGLFLKCEDCKAIIWKKDLEANFQVCPKCDYHFKISARRRLQSLLDEGRYQEFDADIRSSDPLGFVDRKPYRERLRAMEKQTGEKEAVINARGRLGGAPVVAASMEYSFIGGSMGSVVGEKITRTIETALAERCPLVIVSASGGARMMEGALSLMQMAKISTALARLDESAVPYISVLTDPTTGGVTASFAMLGDLIIAEPKALIGFAGPRVIEQTIRQKLPEGFQRAEFLLEHGMLDAVVHRRDLRDFLVQALKFLPVRPAAG